ncbi:VOC family protein [Lichenifustis flavocetrariae]|uniref:VOC family protein n=1 Tax=Lichenifustis flavocetrariae TaxID=2949735 RepID=A0AA41Z5K6_9HYPH|nr:VOC family protein [Lichenifustis flavocetrariae]MCW6513200.1 VOC family protein [Lichenifustis flavocetrariae]
MTRLVGRQGCRSRGITMLNVVTHPNFRAQAREALGFYRSVFGGQSTIMSYADAHSVTDPSEADQVMWGQVVADDGLRIMAFDMPASRPWSAGEAPFFVSVSSAVEAEISSRWDRLRVGGTVLHPLLPAAWAPLYGMVKDRFGITWNLAVDGAHAVPAANQG